MIFNPGPATQIIAIAEILSAQGNAIANEHEVAEGRFCKDGTVLIECTCGLGQFSDTEAESKAKYARHLSERIGIRL